MINSRFEKELSVRGHLHLTNILRCNIVHNIDVRFLFFISHANLKSERIDLRSRPHGI